MITMTEIARLTRVSQPTVSRVLNGNGNVAPDIRERVLACAKEHDYQLNVLAKSLQGSKTKLFGLLLTDISNSFFADLAKQIESEARKFGYSMILFNSDYDIHKEKEYMDLVRRYRVDGILVVPIETTGSFFLNNVKKLDLPVISVTRRVEGVDSIYLNHTAAGAKVAQHLNERGYQEFLFVGRNYECEQEYELKYLGVSKTLFQSVRNLKYLDDKQMTDVLKEYFHTHSARVGIFAGNDIHALKILKILRELDIQVPERAGVIGFDDTYMGRYVSPTLSSVKQPIHQIAREAVLRLIYRIENPGEHPVLDMPLEATLVVREST